MATVNGYWKVFKKAMYERFGYKNAEHAARDRLHSLEQRNMSYAQYVNAFDDCYAHIPNYDEADKVHRFLRGLRPNLRNRLCINPVTFCNMTILFTILSYSQDYCDLTEYERVVGLRTAHKEGSSSTAPPIPWFPSLRLLVSEKPS